MTQFEILKSSLFDKREQYKSEVDKLIDSYLTTDKITEDEAAELKMYF